ncbi:hypothetical protein B0H11DRAFT_2236414 [Mycena galericulata]|nr:hypothetical protein B0H11DRAFT_2236414 [Mycena galericulata]
MPRFVNFDEPIFDTVGEVIEQIFEAGSFADVIPEGDTGPPEHRNDVLNPFLTDIYFLGNPLKREFLYCQRPYDHIEPLVDDMTRIDPALRPMNGEVIGETLLPILPAPQKGEESIYYDASGPAVHIPIRPPVLSNDLRLFFTQLPKEKMKSMAQVRQWTSDYLGL